jgi:hypothetical protein
MIDRINSLPQTPYGPAAVKGYDADRSSPAVDATFLKASTALSSAVTGFIASAYCRVLALLLKIPNTAWLTRDHRVFFGLAVLGLFLITPRFLILGQFAFSRFVLGHSAARPDFTGWPYLPVIIAPLVLAALVTFSFGTAARLASLVSLSLLGGLAFGYLDVASLLAFVAFATVCFAVIRLPISRLTAAFILCALTLTLTLVTSWWLAGTAIAAMAAFQTPLIPMVWYSAYEHKGQRRPLTFQRFVPYLYGRFFAGPVMTYGDMFASVSGERLAEVRFGGIKALYVAAVASIVAAGTDLLLREFRLDELTGLPLLIASYAGYVGMYCKIVVAFNTVTGILRLFGLPVRDSFNYWLLARTPNEHWQRWNLLFREWVITFVFFPIMRAKRWLFAVMSALIVSGALHLIPAAMSSQWTVYHTTIEVSYWIINGLAIYFVIKIPGRFPRLISALGVRDNLAWSIIGIVLTSSFYSILYGMRASGNWTDLVDYCERLVTSVL